MASYFFITDSDSDLHYTIADEKNIPVVQMPYTLKGEEHLDDNGRSGAEKVLFDAMRAGETPSTSLLPTPVYVEFFEPYLKEKDVLFVAFSSQMSATFKNVLEAREELLAKYPDRRFVVVDTLSISAPMVMLILGAHALYEQGKTMDEVEQWLLDNRDKSQVWVTVDDLVYLKRGGRVSPTQALFGSMLSIKPILTMTREGKLDAVTKVQGRKNALKTLVDKAAENIGESKDKEILVIHGDCLAEGEQLVNMLKQRMPDLGKVTLQMIGPVIGCHAGPGTLALAFMGKQRPF